MKKKLSLFILAILVVPLFAFFGCTEPTKHQISVETNCETSGFPELNGSPYCDETFNEGSSVTVNAIVKDKTNGSFICWLFQGSKIVVDGGNYKIVNTQGENSNIIKSTLTFTANSSTEGKYTAVFSDSKMTYAKLDSFCVTTDLSQDPQTEINDNKLFTASEFSVRQNSNQGEAYSASNVDIFDNVLTKCDSISQVLKLLPASPAQLVVKLKYENSTREFRLGVNYLQDTENHENDIGGYSYSATYSDGTYKIVVKFKINDKDNYLILNYKNLTA